MVNDNIRGIEAIAYISGKVFVYVSERTCDFQLVCHKCKEDGKKQSGRRDMCVHAITERDRVKPMTGGGLKWMPQIIQLFGSSSVNL